MTTFSGYIVASDPLAKSVAKFPSPYAAPVMETAQPNAVRESVVVAAGAFTSHQPLNVHGREFSGAYTHSYGSDFYNRIMIIPQRVDFGTLSSAVSHSVYVWNAFLTSQTLESVVLPDSSVGITIDAVTPKVFKPLEAKTYTLTASGSGTREISGNVEFDFTGLPAIDIAVSGTRAAMFNFGTNWSGSYKVTRTYRTTVFTSRSGKEQRRAMRASPRKVIEYDIAIFSRGMSQFNRTMAKSIGYAMVMPDESRYALTTSEAAALSTTMDVASVPTWLASGASVLVRGHGQSEERRVSSVTGTTVEFNGPTALDWLPGTQILYVVAGRVAVDGLQTTMETNSVSTMTVSFEVTPLSDAVVSPAAPAVTFNGREVFLTKPNWAQQPSVTVSRPYNTVDYDQGAIAQFNRIDFFSRAEQATYLGLTPAKVQELEDLFDRMKGMLGEFYKPTWQDDFEIMEVAHAGTDTIRVAGSEFAEAFGESTVNKAFMVVNAPGDFDFYQIDTLTVDPLTGDSLIKLPSALTTDIDPAAVQQFCWLQVNRFATDVMVTEWITNTVAQIQLSVVTLEDLPPET